ncbi:CRISPR-associated endoribonuclease Cas6 [Saprospira grandis DSM 2844]|uniref:CRISPR-associated endoribonuclease Cas6 n=1 Tax=Saprospira grandis DSM 2844 TaxID=694433 RepID=J0NXC2_9BACT|nr:CRISPR-associated endoribonuclease Cas6 [Saprospira grandis]EJF52129.1 CRISPR-associated endoribonuclease Cas6 [Saprospira grandis DSM 2844]
MRIYLSCSAAKEAVPFGHLPAVVGAVHKWLGPNNDWHGGQALFSFSSLQAGRLSRDKKSLDFGKGADWFISFYEEEQAERFIAGVQEDQEFISGMRVREMSMQPCPDFEDGTHKFWMASPLLLKRPRSQAKGYDFLTYEQEDADALLTEKFRAKLAALGLANQEVKLRFLRDHEQAKVRLLKYKGIANKGSLCPVEIKGSAEALRLAWLTGLGNSTGIGFGALK